MADLTDAAIDAALDRGRVARTSEPRAAAARYDRQAGRIIVDLTNGCTFAFPPRLAQGLEEATDDQLATVEILGRGYGRHWEALDVDLSLPGLMAGIFGTQVWMAPGAGQATPPAKAAASHQRRQGRPSVKDDALRSSFTVQAFSHHSEVFPAGPISFQRQAPCA